MLGTIAAMTVGAGAAFAQSPKATVPPPSAMAPVVAYDGGVQPAGGPAVSEILPPNLGGYPPQGGPGGDPGAQPMYPPGLHGQPQWQNPLDGPASPAASSLYLNSKLLLYFVKAQPTNIPYVSTSAPQDSGLAGRPTTTTLFSREGDLGYNLFAGFDIRGGWFCDTDRRYGVEIGGMLLERKSNSFFAASDDNGIPVLARPFIDATTGGPAVLTVAQQGLASGSIHVSTINEIYGAEFNIISNLYRSAPECGWGMNVTTLVGFRYMEIHEDLRIASASTIIGSGATFNGAGISSPAVVAVTDTFDVFNRFYGGQVGFNSTFNRGRWFFGVNSKIAFGLMNQRLDIDGRSDLVDTQRNIFAQAVGGLYANAQNMGRYRNDEFAVIPEGGISLGRNWSSWFSTSIGYNYIHVSRVLRPGNVVSNVVNPAIIATSQNFGSGSVAPIDPVNLAQDEFWVQGVTFQMLFKY